MKIGLLINKIDTHGGIQKNYRLLYELFKSKGHEVYLFVLHKPKLVTVDDPNIIFLKGFTKLGKGISLRSQLKQLTPFDLFLVNAEYMKRYLPFKEYYITVHNTWSSKLKGGLRGWVKKQKLRSKYFNEDLIGISQNVLDDITDTLHIPVKSKTVIHAPHDIDSVRELAKEPTEIEGEYIIGIGGLQKRKQFDMLIRAFHRIEAKHPALQLIIIGKGSEKKNLEALIRSLKLDNRVKLLGFRENPYPYIKHAKALVSSSFSEGLPRVIVEALILGTPAVSTYASDGVLEVMQNELRDYVVPKDDEKRLSKTIEQALSDYPKISEKMYAKFDQETILSQYLELIDRIQQK